MRGPFSPVRTTVLFFFVCGPAAPVVLHTLMTLCLLSSLLGMMVFIDYLCVTNPGGHFFDHLPTSSEFYRPAEKV